MKIQLKRVYDPPAKSDGLRVLVERLWPRGLSKDRAAVDVWLRDIAPSTALRKWYQHDPSRWSEFQRRYRCELESNGSAVEELQRVVGRRKVTFVYGSKETTKNSASVLKAFLNETV